MMNRLEKQVLIASIFAFGLTFTPAMAQHDGHGDEQHGDHAHNGTASAPASLPKCPVTNEPVNLAVSVATDTGPVYFCCKDCVSKYTADSSKYAAKVADQRKALAGRPKVQVTCPVSGEPADQKVFIESNGQKVYLCCKGCVNKYQRDPSKYATALANSYTYQTKCPVMGEEIDPQAFVAATNGMNIHFCCKGCDKKFFKDPQKYTPNLVAQGFTVDPKEMVHNVDAKAADEHGSHDDGGHDHGH